MHLTDAMDLLYFTRSTTVQTPSAKPVLRILDRTAALAFYGEWLGFSVDWEYRPEPDAPVYLQVSRGGLVLHLTEAETDCAPGGRVHIDDFPHLHAYCEMLAENARGFVLPEIGPAAWDESITRMEITDPFGNKLVLTENCPWPGKWG